MATKYDIHGRVNDEGDRVIGLDLEIVPGKSIGGICLGDNADDIVWNILDEFDVQAFDFDNFGMKYTCYRIDGGAISFSANEAGNIVSLCCKPPYTGRFDKRFYPGITAGEIKARSKRQELVGGYLVLDRNYLAYYAMPDEIDDFDRFSDLDDDVVFNELYVGNLA